VKFLSKQLTHLPRVEGHGKIYVEIDRESKRVLRVNLGIVEGSRFFEVFLKGRNIIEVPQIASRICGLCGVSHAVCSAIALENALGLDIPESVRRLREVIMALNTIESHLIHVGVLSFPDYFNVKTFLELPELVRNSVIKLIKLRTLVGKLLELLTGDRIHPRNIVPGGFTYLPSRNKVLPYLDELSKYIDVLYNLFEVLRERIKLPSMERVGHYAALFTGNDYPLHTGSLIVDSKFLIPHKDFKNYFIESVVQYSTAKRSLLFGKESYMVGALARLNTNYLYLAKPAKELLNELGLNLPSLNPYLIPIAQAIEIVHFLDYIIRELKELELTGMKVCPTIGQVRRGIGVGIVEAPRGILYHMYEIDGDGKVRYADIVTPTAQNFADIEESIKYLLPKLLRSNLLVPDNLKYEIEKLVRCYDPCISCSVHVIFMK